MASEPSVNDRPAASRFEIDVDGEVAGFAAYHRSEGVIELTHTVIDEGHEGQGLGGTLVRAALDHARQEGLRVVPTCSFVKEYVEQHEEYADLVAPAP